MNNGSPTTFSKVLETLLWVAVSAAIPAIASYLANNPALFNPVIMAVINILLVTLKNLNDPQVPNV